MSEEPFIARCTCGYEMPVSEFAIGMTTQCPECGVEFVVTGDLVEAPDITEQSDLSNLSEQSTGSNVQSDYCARCNRPFRGDWDRHATTIGEVCNICAYSATEAIERVPEKPAAPTPSQSTQGSERTLPTPNDITKEEYVEFLGPGEEDPKTLSNYLTPDNKRKIAIGLACLVLGAALFLTIIGPSESPTSSEQDEVSVVDLSPGQRWILILVESFFGIGAHFAAIYYVLKWEHNLPNKELWKNVVVITPVAIWLALALLICSGVSAFPIVGPLLALIAKAIVIYYTLDFLYSISLKGFLMYFVYSYICQKAAYLVGVLVLAVLGRIFF